MKILSSNFIFDLIFANELKPFRPEPLNNLIKKFSNKSSLWWAVKTKSIFLFKHAFIISLYLFSLAKDCKLEKIGTN